MLPTRLRRWSLLLALVSSATTPGSGDAQQVGEPTEIPPGAEALGIALEGFAYPHPVRYLPLTWDGQHLRMAFMDVAPVGAANGRAVVLMHGKNFFGEYWWRTIDALAAAGYRVVVPDQIGFGKSSKPDVAYSFHRLAANTAALLDALGVERAAVVGHSMGGMLATRFALQHPERTTHLVLENPIGMEDLRTRSWSPIEERLAAAMETSEDAIRRYHRTYYVEWREEYERYVQVHWRWSLSGEYPRLAKASALTSRMIYEQPVIHEMERVAVPALFVIGQADRTMSGERYPALARAAAAAVPDGRLLEMEGVGHAPHLEAAGAFHEALLEFLARGGG